MNNNKIGQTSHQLIIIKKENKEQNNIPIKKMSEKTFPTKKRSKMKPYYFKTS